MKLIRTVIPATLMAALCAVTAAAHQTIKTENHEFIKEAAGRYQHAAAWLETYDKYISTVAEDALKAARAARDAKSDEERRHRLAEYERARGTVQSRFSRFELINVRRDHAEAREIMAEAAEKNLTEREAEIVARLGAVTKRRVGVLEEAHAKLEEAERIARRVRNALEGLNGGDRHLAVPKPISPPPLFPAKAGIQERSSAWE